MLSMCRYHDNDAFAAHHDGAIFKDLIAWFDGSGIKHKRTINRFEDAGVGFWAR